MKRDALFEVLEPPAHGLTRLRARIDERRSVRVFRFALVGALAAAVALVLWPARDEVDLTTPVAELMNPAAPVEALGTTSVVALPSGNPRVTMYRAFAAP